MGKYLHGVGVVGEPRVVEGLRGAESPVGVDDQEFVNQVLGLPADVGPDGMDVGVHDVGRLEDLLLQHLVVVALGVEGGRSAQKAVQDAPYKTIIFVGNEAQTGTNFSKSL